MIPSDEVDLRENGSVCEASAIMKFHWYLLEAKRRGSVRVPYVLIELPLAAISGGPGCRVCVSSPVAGRTLTLAPVSTRNCCLVMESQR